jgi:hypothetical protein
MTSHLQRLSRTQKIVLGAAFVPMLATGIAGGAGTYSNISSAYGTGTALGAVAAGEGATAVLALVLLGLTMLGQASPLVIRLGLWALPAAASGMSAMAAEDDPGRMVIYAVTPMGMCVSAEGMAFLARRIVVHLDGRDAEAERKTATLVQALAFHRAVSVNHPDKKVRGKAERKSWKLARKAGVGDVDLGARLVTVQRERVTHGADAALADMYSLPTVSTGRGDHDNTDELPAPTDGVHNSPQITVNRSTPELETSTSSAATAAAAKVEAPEPTPQLPPAAESSTRERVAAAATTRPRRATGRVPKSARSPRTNRTADELLEEARSATKNWSTDELTAEGIRRAVRTSAEKARGLRDTLRAERAEAVAG